MSDFVYQPGSYIDTGGMTCRDRHGVFNASFFHFWACVWCYRNLFPNQQGQPQRPAPGETQESEEDVPKLHSTFLHFLEIKNTLCASPEDLRCQRLTACCQAASECCNNQIKAAMLPGKTSRMPNACPMTWDGYACFDPTPAGQVAQVKCPSYITERTTANIATKQCMDNGSWWRNDKPRSLEWTDYTRCVSIEIYYTLYYVGVSCSIASLVCLVPACIIFISIKQLRKQHRIHIHLNLFASFTLTSCVWLTWDHLVFKNRLESSHDEAIMHQQIAGCRALYVLSRYSWTCNFVWMSLEGFHLYRLINHAFQTPKSIAAYYLIGWLFPLLPIGIYITVRLLYSDYGCWVTNAGHYEWIMYCPIILCLTLNIFFLVNVLRALMTQIQRHSNEPSHYRRALKATLILVPLFGLQLLLVIYRPGDGIETNAAFEIFSKIINNTQGMIVTIVFCFMNSEVHNLLRGHVICQGPHYSSPDIISGSLSAAEVRRHSLRGSSLNADGYMLRKLPAAKGGSGLSRKENGELNKASCLVGTKEPQKQSSRLRDHHLSNTTSI